MRRRRTQQILQVGLPDRRERVRAVAGRLVAQRQHDRAAFRHALDLALEDLQLRRVDEVVRGVHGQERRLDLLEAGTGIVVARRFERVEDVVGVAGLDVVRDVLVDLAIGVGERRRCLLPEDRVAAHQPQHLRRRCGGRAAASCSRRSSTRDPGGWRRSRRAARRGCGRRSASAGWPAASARPSGPG